MRGVGKLSKKITGKNIINMLLWIYIYTSSFDIVLVFDVYGKTFRIAQLILIFVGIIYIIEICKKKRMNIPLGIKDILCVALINTVTIFVSLDFGNAIGYDLYFLLNIASIFILVFFFSDYSLEKLVKYYVNSYIAMACLGLIQWILQFAHIYFYVTQIGAMHRCNGFSYEPSYYSTYMLMGWVICMYLLERRIYVSFSKKKMYVIVGIMSLAMILSTSRMGWMMMAAWIALRCVMNYKKFLVGKMTKNMIFLVIILLFFGIVGMFILVAKWDKFVEIFFSGLGIFGTSSHSADGRIKPLYKTMETFKDNFWFGCSIGGVDPYIAYLNGVTYEGNGASMCFTVEALASFGVIGFFFFARFFYILFKQSMILSKKISNDDAGIIKAFLWALVMECIILHFNQNICRIYFWVHIALLCTVYAILKKKYIKQVEKKGI